MPRTKVASKTKAKIIVKEVILTTLREFEFRKTQIEAKVNALLNTVLQDNNAECTKELLQHGNRKLETTLDNLDSFTNTIISTTSSNTTTNSMSTSKRRPKRSRSCIDDEAGSCSSSRSIGPRQSRQRSRAKQPRASSRSVPRNPNTGSYGMITPKVTPNTPQVILRKPIAGELAVSLQGSPLYTGSVITESAANINIPLKDGKCLTIQPQGGLRVSQVPEFDLETRRQLQALRTNLNKICEFLKH